jgi:macrophage erythroblast attacher
MLVIMIEVGLSVLKLPQSFENENFNVNDPLCHKNFQNLSQNIPFSVHTNTKLICRISGKIIDHNNPPMVYFLF